MSIRLFPLAAVEPVNVTLRYAFAELSSDEILLKPNTPDVVKELAIVPAVDPESNVPMEVQLLASVLNSQV